MAFIEQSSLTSDTKFDCTDFSKLINLEEESNSHEVLEKILTQLMLESGDFVEKIFGIKLHLKVICEKLKHSTEVSIKTLDIAVKTGEHRLLVDGLKAIFYSYEAVTDFCKHPTCLKREPQEQATLYMQYKFDECPQVLIIKVENEEVDGEKVYLDMLQETLELTYFTTDEK